MIKLSIDDLLNALCNIHRELNETLSSTRKKAIERNNARIHVRSYLPTVDDYVVVAGTRGPRTKISANWVGPRHVISTLSLRSSMLCICRV